MSHLIFQMLLEDENEWDLAHKALKDLQTFEWICLRVFGGQCGMKLPHHDCVICVVCGHFGAHVGLLAFSSVSFLQSSVEKSPFMCSSQWSGTMYLCSCYLRSWSMVCLIVKEAKNLSVSSCSLCPICLVEYSERIKWPLNSIT